MKNTKRIIAFLLILSLCSACGTDSSQASKGVDLDAEENEIQIDGNEQFMMEAKSQSYDINSYYEKMMGQFLCGEKKNKVFSPTNLFLALSLIAEACDGDTKKEILSLLGMDSMEDVREKSTGIWKSNYKTAENATINTANSLWMSDKYEFNREFTKTCADYYHASSYVGEMGSSEFDESFRQWLNKNTGNLLENQVNNLKLDKDNIMAIVSALYFKAAWQSNRFDEDFTKKEMFYGLTKQNTVDMMKSGTDDVYITDKYMKISLPLSVGDMHIILPNKGVDPEEIIKDGEVTKACEFGDRGAGEEYYNDADVNVSLPRFDIDFDNDVIEGLKKVGVSKVFDSEKSEMPNVLTEESKKKINDQPLYVNKFTHATRIIVDESGVTGASYAESEFAAGAAPVIKKTVDFNVNRPFIYTITGPDRSILFAGVVYDL